MRKENRNMYKLDFAGYLLFIYDKIQKLERFLIDYNAF